MKNIVAVVAGIVFFSLCAVFLLTTIPASGNNATNTVAETPSRHIEAQAEAEKEAKARAELLTQREKEIESRESKLENRAKELDNRSQVLDSRSQELDDKSQVLDNKSRELDDKSQLLDTKSKELTQKEESQAAATVASGKKKPRIAMVSLYYDNHVDHNQLDIVSLSLRNKLTYAHKHGYTYMFYHNDLVDDSKSPHWSKILVLQHYLEMGEWDWLFWVDLDTLIMNMDIKLEDLVEGVDPQTNLILNNDQNGLNNGVFLVRSCEWSVWYMKQVMEMYPITRNHGFKEQQAQTEVHNRKPETRQHIKWVPQRTMNSYSDGPEERMYQQGDFLIHFAGKSAHDKADFMRQYFATSYKYPTNLQMWTVKAVPNPEK